MNLFPCPLRLAFSCLFFGMALSQPARLHALTVAAGEGPIQWTRCSGAMVDGHPAIAWFISGPAGVKYARALDGTGTVWGPTATLDSGMFSGFRGERVGLFTVNGNPAVCYIDAGLGKLKFVRALNATGSAWGAPVILDTGEAPPFDFSVEIIDGKPAICFIKFASPGIMLRRATDPDGSAWGPIITVDPTIDPFPPALKIVDGRPAVLYTIGEDIWYLRALDAAGTQWPQRTRIHTPGAPIPLWVLTSFQPPALMEVNHLPAFTYFDSLTKQLHFLQAANPDGTLWKDPVSLNVTGEFPAFTAPALINGKPAIGIQTGQPLLDLKYMQALNSDPATAAEWEAPANVDLLRNAASSATLFEVNGVPAIAYLDDDTGDLVYVRASTAGGSSWPAQIRLEEQNGTQLSSGGILNFGSVAQGGSAILERIITNPNSSNSSLLIYSVTIDGPDAAEFSVLNPLANTTLNSGGSAVLRVRHAPVKPGVKSATLHILSDAENFPSYNLTLTGNSLPDISLEQPAGLALTDGTVMNFPVNAAGDFSDYVFTVRNIGVANLTGFFLTIDGINRNSFTVLSPPAPVVIPGGTTSFTIRHGPGDGEPQTAALHLASNAPGSRNPFDVTITTVRPGLVDKPFDPSFQGVVERIVVRGDGRILAHTQFDGLLCFNADGTANTGFFAPAVNGSIQHIAAQKDGKVLIAGNFTHVEGKLRRGLARLHPDGSLDEGFVSSINGGISCLAVQADGKILAGGTFTVTEGGPQRYLARTGTDGSPDPGFTPVLNSQVLCLALQPDGKILAGGRNGLAPFTGHPIVRFGAGGTPDNFTLGAFAQTIDAVNCIEVQPDGKILAGGIFTGVLLRCLPDGTLDPSLSLQAAGQVNDLALQADGKCLAAGGFSVPGSLSNLVRFNVNGSVNSSFRPNPNLPVFRIAVQADGKVLTGGLFSVINDVVSRPGFVRLNNDPASTTLRAEGSSTVRWLRSGSAVEVRDVTFDVKPENSPDWIPLGAGTRVTGGWLLTGLTLPSSGTLRAQGYAGPSVMESVVPLLPPFERWRQQYFGTPSSTGDAADTADPDRDGLTNFQEYAFGLSPVDGGSNALPEFKLTGGTLTASFTAPPGRENILYGAEWSAAMQPGTWTAIPDTGTQPLHRFTIPLTGQRKFARFVIRAN